jgi:hypothetical protein
MRNAYRILIGKPEGERWGYGRRLEENIRFLISRM